MSTASTEAQALALAALRKKPSLWAVLWGFFKAKPLGAWGGLTLLVLVFVAIFAAQLSPYDPFEMHYDKLFAPPGGEFLLGSDNFGRDLLSRIIHGSRISLTVGLGAVGTASVIGAVLGLVGGYFGGRTDMLTQRFLDAMMSFPTLVLALTIVAALGSSLLNVIIAIAIVDTPRVGRVVRSAAIAIKETQYVDAAKMIGASDTRILFAHILPNSLAPWFVYASLLLGTAILTEATLSFLGLGVPPPHPSWGGMLSGAGREFVEKAPWMAIYPGLAITLAVFGFNLLGDALRDVLDPRLRR